MTQKIIMSSYLITTKCLHLLFQNWDSTDEGKLIVDSPKKISDDIKYVLNEKLKPLTNKRNFNLSSALMSDFFMCLNEDSAEYVLQYALQKNKGMFIF